MLGKRGGWDVRWIAVEAQSYWGFVQHVCRGSGRGNGSGSSNGRGTARQPGVILGSATKTRLTHATDTAQTKSYGGAGPASGHARGVEQTERHSLSGGRVARLWWWSAVWEGAGGRGRSSGAEGEDYGAGQSRRNGYGSVSRCIRGWWTWQSFQIVCNSHCPRQGLPNSPTHAECGRPRAGTSRLSVSPHRPLCARHIDVNLHAPDPACSRPAHGSVPDSHQLVRVLRTRQSDHDMQATNS